MNYSNMTAAIIYNNNIIIEHGVSDNVYQLLEMLIISTHANCLISNFSKLHGDFGFSLLQ